jgi:glucosamine--fructose-6-phosphate aminotransferase (isomerizing)
LLAKNVSTIEEIHARRGPTFIVTHEGAALPAFVAGVIEVPKSEPELDPLLLNLPLQLLAYHVALAKGRDIDQPRNLAKSVTVE